MTRKASLSRKEFLAWTAALLAGIPWLGRSVGAPRPRKEGTGRTEPELKEADYYSPHPHGG
jgi:hypothetical protein